MPKEIKDINFNAGFNGCEARMQILKNEVVQRDLENFDEIGIEDIDTQTYIYVDKGGDASKIKLASVTDPREGIQSDWAEDNSAELAYIKNKPDFTLEEDIISPYTIGSIKVNDILHKGMSALDILKMMFGEGETFSLKVCVLNDSFTNSEINLSGISTIEYSIANALTDGFSFTRTFNNQYYGICLNKEVVDHTLTVDKVYQGSYKLNYKTLQLVDDEKVEWILFYQPTPVTGTYTFNYTFVSVNNPVDSEGNQNPAGPDMTVDSEGNN